MVHRTVQSMQTKSLEAILWEAADSLRGSQDPSDYKHVVLGLIFLRHVSARFEERQTQLKIELEADGIPPDRVEEFLEERDEYTSKNVFWVPASARWENIQSLSDSSEIGAVIDNAMNLIEEENAPLRGALGLNYGRASLDKKSLGSLVRLIGSIGVRASDNSGADDILGRVYDHFLEQFINIESGKDAGSLFTPRSVVKTLVEMLQPYKGRVYDPAAGSGGMLVQSARFVSMHGGKPADISVYGQERSVATWRLAKMSLALRGIEADMGPHAADSFTENLHSKLEAEFVISNPPFNVSNWWDESLVGDPRWKYGKPPLSNANFAWVQHFLHHLAPNGAAGFVLANGSLYSKESGGSLIRQRLVEEGVLDCIVAMPNKLFSGTGIPVSLWFMSKLGGNNRGRAHKGEVLFIDAGSLGAMETRRLRVLSDEDIAKISNIYHDWRSDEGTYRDVPGFAVSVSVEEIRSCNYVLTPGQYVVERKTQSEDEPIEMKIARLKEELLVEMGKSRELEDNVLRQLGDIGV